MKQSVRYWEIDAVRALAFCLMLLQHTMIVHSLVFKDQITVSTLIQNTGKAGAWLFLLLVGLSGYLSYHKGKSLNTTTQKFLVRGGILLLLGLVVSIASFLVVPSGTVYFGVLSFIGLSLILLPYLIKYRPFLWILFFTAPVIAYITHRLHPISLTWIVFGAYPRTFQSLDYWPLFPWISLLLGGVIVGEQLYKKGSRQFKIWLPQGLIISLITWIGSHTLALYMIHLPILYVLFIVVKQVLKV